MAWIEKLYSTYEACKGREPPGAERLMPVSHSVQQAHIEITLDEEGNFKEARSISKEETVIPATEKICGAHFRGSAAPALRQGSVLRIGLLSFRWSKNLLFLRLSGAAFRVVRFAVFSY